MLRMRREWEQCGCCGGATLLKGCYITMCCCYYAYLFYWFLSDARIPQGPKANPPRIHYDFLIWFRIAKQHNTCATPAQHLQLAQCLPPKWRDSRRAASSSAMRAKRAASSRLISMSRCLVSCELASLRYRNPWTYPSC